jgi:hypothetical protein
MLPSVLLRATGKAIKATSELRCLHRHHLLRPPCSWLWATNGTYFISREARDANVVLTLEDDLNVADVESVGTSDFGESAGSCDQVVNEVVGDLQEYLGSS